MPASQEQKVDFLLKKIGYSASKTGIAEDESTIGLSTNTAKAPFEEGIASPLVIPQSSILADSGYIPTTPPGSDTPYVKGYRTATALRMTRDSTVGTNTRSYIAYTTYNDTSSARLTNWIDTQFGASYIIKVFKGDPNSSGVELQQAGASGGDDGWFFDYSSGVLNFNGVILPDGVNATNIYIVGYRYIGATGIRPPAGIGTFESLHVSGIATFKDDVEFHGASGITSIRFDKSDNSFKFIDNARLKFGDSNDLHIYHDGGTSRVRDEGTGILLLEGDTIKLGAVATGNPMLVARQGLGVSMMYDGNTKFETKNEGIIVSGGTTTGTLSVTGVSTFLDTVKIGTGVTALTDGNVSIGGTFEIFETSGVANQNYSQFKLSTFSIGQHNNVGTMKIMNNNATGTLIIGAGGGGGYGGITLYNKNLNVKYLQAHNEGGVDLYHDGDLRFVTTGVGATVFGNLDVTGIITASAGQNKIPSLYNAFSDLPNASHYHGLFAHVHEHGRGYFAHGGAWYELVNKESDGRVGTGTETYNVGFLDATNLDVTGITTLGSIGISTGRITGPAITYIDPATVGDDTGTLVVKGNLQVEGTQTVVNSSTMTVTDVNIELAKGASNDAAADTGGITVKGGTDKTWQWLDATDSWTSSEHIRIPDGKVFGFTPDTNTHISRPAADQLLLTTGGTGRARFLNTQTKIGPDADSATESTNYEFQISSYTGPVCHIFSLRHSGNGSVSNVLKQAFFFKNASGNSVDFARIQAECTDVGNGTEKGDLVFYTTNNQTAGEKLRITGIGSVGINSTAPTALLDVNGTSQFQDDVTFTTASGNNIVFDKSDNQLEFGNDVKAEFGANGQLEVNFESNSGNSVIKHTSNLGSLVLHSDNLDLRPKSNTGHVYLRANYNDGVDLYFANDKKFETIGVGVTVFGTTQTQQLNVSGIGTIGSGSSGQSILQYQGSTKLSTANWGVSVAGTLQATNFIKTLNQSSSTDGKSIFLVNTSGNLLEIGHASNNSFITGHVGNISINAPQVSISTNFSVAGISTITQLEIGTLGQSLVGITTILDEDDMASNSATALVTQQSLVAYVGNSAPGGSALSVSADSGSNESINLSSEVLDIEGTANEIETATGTNKVVIGLPDNVSIGGTLNVGVGLSVVGVSTFADVKVSAGSSITIPNYNDNTALFLGDFTTPSVSGSTGARLKQNTTDNTSFEFNNLFNTGRNFYISAPSAGGTLFYVSSNSTIGAQLYCGGNNLKLQTVGTGITVYGKTETQQLNVSGISTFAGKVSAGGTTGTDGYYLKSTGIGVTWAVFPSSRTTSTQTATAGQTSFNFNYNIGFVDVFLNGVKLPSSEFTASNGSTIVLDDAAFANDTLEFISLNTVPVTSGGGSSNLDGLADVSISGTPVIGETLQHNGSEFVNDYTVSATTTSTSQTAILSLPIATYRSAEYTIQVTEGTKYHVTKVLAIHDGTNVTFNEYGTLTTSTSLSTFALDVNSGNMRLLATPASTNSTVFKVKFTGIKV